MIKCCKALADKSLEGLIFVHANCLVVLLKFWIYFWQFNDARRMQNILVSIYLDHELS